MAEFDNTRQRGYPGKNTLLAAPNEGAPVQSTAFRFVSVIVTLLLAAALVGLVVLTLRSQPAVTIEPLPTSTPTTVPTPTATPFETLGADLISLEGGYRFQPLLGYEVTMQGAATTLLRRLKDALDGEANNDVNPQASTIALDVFPLASIGLRREQPLEDAIMQIAQPFISRTAAELGALETIRIGAAEGVSLSLRTVVEGVPVAGRIAVARRDADTLFVVAATAPTDIWTTETDAAMQNILQSVAFFEEAVASSAPTPISRSATTPTGTQTPDALPIVTVVSAQTPAGVSTATSAESGAGLLRLTQTPDVEPAATPTVSLTTLLAPTPTPANRTLRQAWTVVSDANRVNDLVVAGNTIWIATDGGALAWTRGGASPVKFTSINGLTANRLTTVVDCELPSLGILFGSEDGLQIVNLFAGGWRQLNSRNSELRYDDVSALACNVEAGYLVIGYARHGIDVFNARTNTWRHIDRNSGLASNTVLDLAVVGALTEIWVVSDDGITVSAGPDSTFYTVANSPLESSRIGAIAADPGGGVWVGGDGVLYRIDGEQWTVFSAEEVGDDGFPLRLITGLAPTGAGDLWLGDIDGTICRFDPATASCLEAFRREDGTAVAALTRLSLDDDGQLYVATAGNGFSVYDGATWRRFFKPNEGVAGNAIFAAAFDADNALWVVTDAGVQRIIAPTRPPELLPESGIDLATIRTIYAARNGNLWIGGDGAAVWDGATWRQFTPENGLAGGEVRAIAEDSRGRIWLGSDAGVSIWNGVAFVNLTRETGLPSADIRSLLADGAAMWIGSAGGGLYRFALNQLEVFTVENIGLPSDTITALALDNSGLLFIGTAAGLAELENGIVTPIPAVGERAISQILAADGSIWVGTTGDGLFFDVGEGWQHETTVGALPDNRVTVLAAVDGEIWVGGATGGLLRYSLPTKE